MASNTSDTLSPTNSDEVSPRKPILGPYDVLDGKGRRADDGNKYYRSIMRLFKRDKDYIIKSKNSKKSNSLLKERIAEVIYDHVISKGGFFRKGNKEVKSREDSIKKITQSLRDYSRPDRHVYNNQDKVDGCFPEIRHIEEKVSKYETFDKQYEVAIEELQILTQKTIDRKRRHEEDVEGIQKRKREEYVEGMYVPYSKNPFLPTSTGYETDQNLIRSKESQTPSRLLLSNPHWYETFDANGNKTWGHGSPQKLVGESDQLSPLEFLIYKNVSTYTLYTAVSMNTVHPARVVAKRKGQKVFFAIQACRKRNLVASLACEFNDFLKKHVPPKAGFPRIVILPCGIYDGNILVEKRLSEEKWEDFTIQPQKKMDENFPSSSPIPEFDCASLHENTSLLDDLNISGHGSIADALSQTLDETLFPSLSLPSLSLPTEESNKQIFDLDGNEFDISKFVYLFMAFAFMKTDRQVAIYKLKGSLDSYMNPITYELTDPSIHTSRNLIHENLGDDDEGEVGIEKFAKLIEPYEQLLRKYNQQENIDTRISRVFEA